MVIDNEGYIYLTSEYSSNYLARSIETTVGINEKSQNSNIDTFIIYPNPVHDKLYVYPLNKKEDYNQKIKINIYSLNGSIVIKTTIGPLENSCINVNMLKPGIYISEIILKNNKRYQLKFIKY
jgi:hypothetical protein